MDLRDIGRAFPHTVATGPDPAPALLPRRFDRWRGPARPIAAAFGLLIAVTSLANVKGYGNWGEFVGVLSTLPLALAVYRPLLAWRLSIVTGLIALTTPAPDTQTWPWYPHQVFTIVVVLFVVATTQPPPVQGWIWLLSAIPVLVFVDDANRIGALVVFALLLVFGDQIRRRVRTQRELAAEEERGTLLAERARIAREMHDVVAHHMSLIAVRTETAPYRLGTLPEPVRVEFSEVSREAREALNEMRRLLGVLRDSADGSATAPQPGLPQLPALIAATVQAGATVRLDAPDPMPDVPAIVGLSAYRVAQEALANAVRHAPGAPIAVSVSESGDTLGVHIHNGPSTKPPARDGGPGHGLIGMRERVTLLGGTLTAGPATDGGFDVRATFAHHGGTV